jgi:hypothetical protein
VEVCDSNHRRVTGNLVAGAWPLDRLRGDMDPEPRSRNGREGEVCSAIKIRLEDRVLQWVFASAKISSLVLIMRQREWLGCRGRESLSMLSVDDET